MYGQLATNTLPVYGDNLYNESLNSIEFNDIEGSLWKETFATMLSNNYIDGTFEPKNFYKEPYSVASAIADTTKEPSFVDPLTLGPDALHALNPIIEGQKEFTYFPGQDWENMNDYAKRNLLKDMYNNGETIGYNNMLTSATKEISDGKLSALNSYRPLDLSKVMQNNSSNYSDNIEPHIDIAYRKYETVKRFNDFYENDNHYLMPFIEDNSSIVRNSSTNYNNRLNDNIKENIDDRTINIMRADKQNITTNGYNDIAEKEYKTRENYKIGDLYRRYNNDCIIDDYENVYRPVNNNFHEFNEEYVSQMDNFNNDEFYGNNEQSTVNNIESNLSSKRLYYNHYDTSIGENLPKGIYIAPNYNDEIERKFKPIQIEKYEDNNNILDDNHNKIKNYLYIDEYNYLHLPTILFVNDSDKLEEMEYKNNNTGIINLSINIIDLDDYVREIETLLSNKKNIIILPAEIDEISKPILVDFIKDLRHYFTDEIIAKGINICSIDKSSNDILNYMEILNSISNVIKNTRWEDIDSQKKLNLIGKQIIKISDKNDFIDENDYKAIIELYKSMICNNIIIGLKNGKVLIEIEKNLENILECSEEKNYIRNKINLFIDNFEYGLKKISSLKEFENIIPLIISNNVDNDFNLSIDTIKELLFYIEKDSIEKCFGNSLSNNEISNILIELNRDIENNILISEDQQKNIFNIPKDSLRFIDSYDNKNYNGNIEDNINILDKFTKVNYEKEALDRSKKLTNLDYRKNTESYIGNDLSSPIYCCTDENLQNDYINDISKQDLRKNIYIEDNNLISSYPTYINNDYEKAFRNLKMMY